MRYKTLIVSFLTALILFFSYNFYSKQIPVHDYDERWWVRDSWTLVSNSDQPMLLKYIFKLWLYPKYSKVDMPILDNMVIDTRVLSHMVLSIHVLFVSLFLLRYKGFIFSTLFLLLYAWNRTILDSALLAQSESIFLFLFTVSTVFVLKYFLDDHKNRDLIIFSVATGLAFSTKLNGILPYILFLVIYNIKLLDKNFKLKLSTPITLFSPIIIIAFIFVALNPFVQNNPVFKTMEMFSHRQQTVLWQMNNFKEYALPNLGDRYTRVSTNLFEHNGSLTWVYVLLFLIGLASTLHKSAKGDKFSKLMMITFLFMFITTGIYYQLNWPRYLIHLIMFVVYYQIEGLTFLISQLLIRRSKKLNAYINHW